MMKRLKQDLQDLKLFFAEHRGLGGLGAFAIITMTIASCCLGTTLGLAMADEGGDGELAATATDAPTMTNEPPTATPRPTGTPTTAPTSTLEPTATTAPTNTPQPTPTDDALSETEYAERMQVIAQDYVDALTSMSDLTSEVSIDPYLMFDSGWRVRMNDTLALIRGCNRRVRALDPPPAFEESHGYMLDAADHMELSATYMERGLDEKNSSFLELAAEEMSLVTQDMQRAVDALP